MLFMLVGGSFSYLYFNTEAENTNIIKASCLKIDINEGSGLSLNNEVPIKDEEGLEQAPYEITLTNTCSGDAYFKTTLNILDTSNIENINKTRIQVEKDKLIKPRFISNLEETTLTEAKTNIVKTYLIDDGYLKSKEQKSYSIKMWIDYDVTSYDGSLDSKVITEAFVKKEDDNALKPTLASNMIPVYYDASIKTWKKADNTNNNKHRWYNYNDKMWANAITYNHNKVYNDAKNIEGRVFNGVDNSIDLGYANTNLGNTLTVGAVVKFDEVSSFISIVGNPELGGFVLETDSDSKKFAFRIYGENSSGYTSAYSTTTIEKGKYYTLVGIYDNNQVKLYLNGVLEGTASLTDNIKVVTTSICIGANPRVDGYEGLFKGTMKEVLVTKEVLSEENIKAFGNTYDYVIDSNTIVHEKYDNQNIIKTNLDYTDEGITFAGNEHINTGLARYDFKNKITLGARIKINGVGSIIDNTQGAGFCLRIHESKKVSFSIYIEESKTYRVLGSNTTLEDDKWYNIIATYDGSEMKIYINGTLDNKLRVTGNIKPSIVPIHIGANPNLNDYGNRYSGMISDVLIMDSILDQKVISKYYSTDFNHQYYKDTLLYYNLRSYESRALGEEIPMDIINTMFVWIPRFNAITPSNYNGGTQANPGPIIVNFVNNNEEAIDAFTFDNNNLDGIWVGKFELSHENITTDTLNCNNETCATSNNLLVKPNKKSLRDNSISNYFYAIRSMQNTNNTSKFDNTIDIHMIKNRDWGAVAYLTQSKYGRCDNNVCSEVGINNNSSFITGYGAEAGSSADVNSGKYDTSVGMQASTTNNIYGIYDMSGGSSEYVMAIYKEALGSSGFSALPNAKYYDNYTTTDYKGHALLETKDWYNDYRKIFSDEYPYMYRGDNYSSKAGAGIFHFYCDLKGQNSSRIGTRPVIINQK